MHDRFLIRQFVRHGSQAAFGEIVKRYSRLVYSTCLREVGDRQLAEDITQGVFLILAQRAPSLGRHVTLSGWLFRTARLVSKDALRREHRRRRREQAAQAETQPPWPGATPHSQETLLNEALAALRPAEREVILLRFFEGASFREVGEALGLTDDAAQKRVSRALDKIRAHFARNQEVLSAAALVGILSAEAARTVPSDCVTPLLQIIPGLKISLLSSGLFESPAHHIAQGVLRTMKAKATLTTGLAGVLAVASVSLLMAGSGKPGGNIVGTWTSRAVNYVYVPIHPMKPGQHFTGPMKRTQQTITDDITYRFNGDGTFQGTAINPRTPKVSMVVMGRYRLNGASLTVTVSRIQQTLQGAAKPIPIKPSTGSAAQTFAAAFSDSGQTLTLTHTSQPTVVFRRQ